MTTPWRIAAQSVTVLDPDTKEPVFTLAFLIDNGNAGEVKLRMIPVDPGGAMLELTFSTGGYPTGNLMKIERKKPEPDVATVDSGVEVQEPALAG